MNKKKQMSEIVSALENLYPIAQCSLFYEGDAFKLLIMGMLSAQCTDERVNIVSHPLFERYPSAKDLAEADISEIEDIIKPCGLFHTKAKHIKETSKMVETLFGGIVPSEMDQLLLFPGVGRKIANLIRGDVFQLPAIVTDTHCIRLCGRFGMYPKEEKNPLKIEKILLTLVPADKSSDFCHRLVLFGREYCSAQSPRCSECPLRKKGLCEGVLKCKKK